MPFNHLQQTPSGTWMSLYYRSVLTSKMTSCICCWPENLLSILPRGLVANSRLTSYAWVLWQLLERHLAKESTASFDIVHFDVHRSEHNQRRRCCQVLLYHLSNLWQCTSRRTQSNSANFHVRSSRRFYHHRTPYGSWRPQSMQIWIQFSSGHKHRCDSSLVRHVCYHCNGLSGLVSYSPTLTLNTICLFAPAALPEVVQMLKKSNLMIGANKAMFKILNQLLIVSICER